VPEIDGRHAARSERGLRMIGRALVGTMAALACLLAVGAPAQEAPAGWNAVRVAIEGSYPPFSEHDGKGFKGFDVDIAKALCARMKANCQLIQRDWDEMQPALLDKEVDAVVASMSITIERKQKFDFTNRYYHTPARFVGRSVDEEIEDWEAWLRGKRVGVQQGTVQERFAKIRFAGGNPLRPFQTQADGLRALASGEIDLFLGDALSLQTGFLGRKEGRGYTFLGPSYNDARWFGEGIGIAVRKEDQGLRWKLNRALDEIRADGTYEKLSQEYFGFDIYGG
jgi:lysine-arginine-ornithine-binding protein